MKRDLLLLSDISIKGEPRRGMGSARRRGADGRRCTLRRWPGRVPPSRSCCATASCRAPHARLHMRRASARSARKSALLPIFATPSANPRRITAQTNVPNAPYCSDCAPPAIQAQIAEDDDGSSAKIRMMLKLLKKIEQRGDGDEKTIVFSQFTTMLDLVEPFLKREGIRYVRCACFYSLLVDDGLI